METNKILPVVQKRNQRTDTYIDQECCHELANGLFLHGGGKSLEPPVDLKNLSIDINDFALLPAI